MRRYLTPLLIILILGGVVIIFSDQVRMVANQIYAQALPCRDPITYRIGSVDPEFGLSEADYRAVIDDAASVWERTSNRDLFAYNQESGHVVVNLIYDYRQEAVTKLKEVGLTISDTESSYDELKTKYDSMRAGYDKKKATLDSQIANFETSQNKYNEEVQSWNARGGAPKKEYERLQNDKEALDSRRESIETAQSTFNNEVETINALATTLNRLVNVLHIQAAKYNAIGRATGGEFEEGVYERAFGAEKIDIFEYADRAELVRVLAHELGHALGLDHVEAADAIMYRLNQSLNGRLTPADLGELERICGV